jgi:hypothetical protein
MICHYFRLSGDIDWGEMRNLQSLRFYPAERLKVLQQEIVFGELRGQFNTVIAASLRNPGNSL